ncbi:MAG: porin, partial [Phenylobacterium sp.]|nr:porin [Phenylobacterium sp.]
MALKLRLLLGAAGLVLAWPGLAAADPVTDAKIAALEEQLSLLQAQIADLKVATSANLGARRTDAVTTSA